MIAFLSFDSQARAITALSRYISLMELLGILRWMKWLMGMAGSLMGQFG
jgi:hypothetical protein